MQKETRVFHVFLRSRQVSLKGVASPQVASSLLDSDLTPFALSLSHSLWRKGVVFKMSLIICCPRQSRAVAVADTDLQTWQVPFFSFSKACRKKVLWLFLFHCFKIGLVYLEGWLTMLLLLPGTSKITFIFYALSKNGRHFVFVSSKQFLSPLSITRIECSQS